MTDPIIVFRRDSIVKANDYVIDNENENDIELARYSKFFEPTIESVSTLLGIDTLASHCIGFTIAIPIDAKIPTKIKRSLKSGRVVTDTALIAYRSLTKQQQLDFLIKEYCPHVVTPFINKGVIVPELTGKGVIHLHIIAQDDDIKDEYDMKDLQAKVSQCLATRRLCKNPKHAIHLNYVHYLTDASKWCEYLQKDRDFMNSKNVPYWVWKNLLELPND